MILKRIFFRLAILFFIFALPAAVGFGAYQYQQPLSFAEIDLLDIGQGDAILIQTPARQNILIDAGADGRLLQELGNVLGFFERDIDLLILTHPDLDHIGGASDLLRRYDVQRVLMTGVLHSSAAYADILQEIARQRIPVDIASAGQMYVFDDGAELEILYPLESRVADDPIDNNATSIVARFDHGASSALFMGDADTAIEAELITAGVNLQADILKLGHHGATTSTSQAFLDAVQPDIALISAGVDNKFGHPRPEVMERITNMQIYRTDEMGTVQLQSNGETWHTKMN